MTSKVHTHLSSNPDAVLNTLRYTFHHMRCGILVCVRNGKVRLIAPYAHAQYRNTFSHKLRFPGGRDGYVAKKCGATRRPPEDWLPPEAWWINGGILCNVMPEGVWGPSHLEDLEAMLTAACAERTIPDCDFFLNKRDYPQLKRDGSEPYTRFTGETHLARESYLTYAPVLSFYGGSSFADVLMPLTEDWKLVSRAGRAADLVGWEATRTVAVWRGTATGNGVRTDTNVRLHLVAAAATTLSTFVDAKLVGYNLRDKCVAATAGDMYVDCLDVATVGPRDKFMALDTQVATYRYVVYVDGHCAANRYGALMACGRVILKVTSLRQEDCGEQWLFPDLLGARVGADGDCPAQWDTCDYDHMVVDADLGNLAATVEFLRDNDPLARRVAYAALSKAPTRDRILDAWRDALCTVHSASVPAATPCLGRAWFSPYDSRYARLGRDTPTESIRCTPV